jgi:hypothetical protein
MVTKQTYFEEAAENNDIPLSDIQQEEQKLLKVIQNRLNKHYKRSRLESGEDYWILQDGNGVWLALNGYELREELREEKVDIDDKILKIIAYGHLEDFQEWDRTIAVPGSIARYHKSDLWYPIYVPFPEPWNDGRRHALQRLQEYVSRYDLSPAETLDYWATEWHSEDAISWAGKRNVDPEAVRKNIRQAKDKLEDEEMGAAHESERIRAVPVDEVPADSPHDKDNDLFYVPTPDQAKEFSS